MESCGRRLRLPPLSPLCRGEHGTEQLNCKEYEEEEMWEGHTFISEEMKSNQHRSCPRISIVHRRA